MQHEPLLQAILQQPTSPFREIHVQNLILATLEEAGVPHFLDPAGNILIGAISAADYKRQLKANREPLRVFISHMDHPGFHGAAWRSPTELEMVWHGGSPTAYCDGASVWLADEDGSLGEGVLSDVKMIPSGRAMERGLVTFKKDTEHSFPRDAKLIFGGLSFRSAVWQEGSLYYTKAADDLVGAFSIIPMAIDHYGGGKKPKGKSKIKKPVASKRPTPFFGLLTRAEEVGFIGAIAHFNLGWLSKSKRRVICVSLETSRALPGAEIGKGPVVRLGDRSGPFSSGPLQVLTALAQSVLPEKHQRRIMDGGTCEATAAVAFGFDSIGISVPLGNYHNQSFEGGPDSRGENGPAPEFVHRDDVIGMQTLCKALIKPGLPWDRPWELKQKDFSGLMKKYKPLMKNPGALQG